MTDIGAPGSTFGMVNPCVIRSSNGNLKVWHNRFSAVGTYDYTLWYSTYTAATSTWSAAVAVTHGGSQLAGMGHPYVTFNGATYTMWCNQGSSGIFVSEAPFLTPTAFRALGSALYNGANTETNVVALANDLLFTEYTTGDPMGWAYSSISAFKAQTYNSKAVAFFGSSHMNNESNYIYRKLVANFGTSNVEHQARI